MLVCHALIIDPGIAAIIWIDIVVPIRDPIFKEITQTFNGIENSQGVPRGALLTITTKDIILATWHKRIGEEVYENR
jgi:hypothetical protein